MNFSGCSRLLRWPARGNGDEAAVADSFGDGAGGFVRGVLLTRNGQDGNLDRAEDGTGVRPLRHPDGGCGDGAGVLLQNPLANFFDQFGAFAKRRVAEESREHDVGDEADAFVVEALGHLVAASFGLFVVEAGVGVAEHQRAEPIGVAAREREGDIAAARESADDGAIDTALVEQARDMVRGVVDGSRCRGFPE